MGEYLHKKVLKPLGNYCLLDQIAAGGMANLYRARHASTIEDSRIFVVKQLRSAFVEHLQSIKTFRTGLKIATQLNHPNIAQLYNSGDHDGLPYLVMEYIHGLTLRQILEALAGKDRFLALQVAVYAVQQAARALSYAHSFRDPITDKLQPIIHRNINPENIMISFEGTIKVIDFGIAKALTHEDQTITGRIRGNPSYLSPEQIRGEPLDGRTDVFSLGAVFWELLTGRKVFTGKTNMETLKNVMEQEVPPPSEVNPEVPPALDLIAALALGRTHRERFKSAADFERSLSKFINLNYPDFVPNDVSAEIYGYFRKFIEDDLALLRDLNLEFENLSGGALPGTGQN